MRILRFRRLVPVLVLTLAAGAFAGYRLVSLGQVARQLNDLSPWSAELIELFNRRADAVARHDEAAFLADVDPEHRPYERDVFQNLLQLDLSTFALTPNRFDLVQPPTDPAVRRRFTTIGTVGVTVTYVVSGVDTRPVAVPWIPTLGLRDGRWVIAGESQGGPEGAGGQPWEGGPITVHRSEHVTLVVSRDSPAMGPHLLPLLDQASSMVLRLRPTGWSGRALIVALDSPTVFASYHFDWAGAITVHPGTSVDQWGTPYQYAGSRTIANPTQLNLDDDEVIWNFAHELTHIATAEDTTFYTPRWLIEGVADYVARPARPAVLEPAAIARVIQRISVPTRLPDNPTFFDDVDNYYRSWLACRLIAERYGEDRLIALLVHFKNARSQDDALLDAGLRSVLHTTLSQFTREWVDYVTALSVPPAHA